MASITLTKRARLYDAAAAAGRAPELMAADQITLTGGAATEDVTVIGMIATDLVILTEAGGTAQAETVKVTAAADKFTISHTDGTGNLAATVYNVLIFRK